MNEKLDIVSIFQKKKRASGEVAYDNASIFVGAGDKMRHSDSQVLSEYSSVNRDEPIFIELGRNNENIIRKVLEQR